MDNQIKEISTQTVVVGTGAAGYNAASRLWQFGCKDVVMVTENIKSGTSRNTGSDKQTYYKLSLAGTDMDSVKALTEDLFAGQCVDGDIALCEAALSSKCFYRLVELGVPFPCNEYGEYIGYKTDHDRGRRATSAGPYTSKIMTECLEQDVRNKNIKVYDKHQLIRILTVSGKVRGILCLDCSSTTPEFIIIWCENVILATGGPAGMYADSVYPASQIGGTGAAFMAGAKGKNLTEWQFGMASVNPRWNVSGTYMQALPRFVSTDMSGHDEREFLLDYFEDYYEILSLIFLKGYQWPFDSNKVFGGSSLIDLCVYQERNKKGRRVFLDFSSNLSHREIEFEKLSQEAFEYLHHAGACLGTPIDRLKHMNQPAVDFYKEHGIDLETEWLEIAECVQHNNGGLSTDCHWETNIRGLFAVGEVCGSHGVTRPGGTALNAGQAGSLRAADYIANLKKSEDTISGSEKEQCRKDAAAYVLKPQLAAGKTSLGDAWKQAAKRMSNAGGMIREKDIMENALCETEDYIEHYNQYIKLDGNSQLRLYYRLYDMLVSQKMYLLSMVEYIAAGGKSRGSALYTDAKGKKVGHNLPDSFCCRLDCKEHGEVIQELWMKEDKIESEWRSVRPVPENDYFFETQWKLYRERYLNESKKRSDI